MTLERTFQIVFAAAACMAVSALALAVLTRVSRLVLVAGAGILAGAAAAGWAAFAYRPGSDLAVAAGGLTVCALAGGAAVGLSYLLERRRAAEEEFLGAEGRLLNSITEESERRGAELSRTLARAHADLQSTIVEEERRLSAERQRIVRQQEEAMTRNVTEALAGARERAEQRVAALAVDLEKAQESLRVELERLSAHQARLVADFEERLQQSSKDAQTAADEQREALVQLRRDFADAAETATTSTGEELEEHAAQRRRALHEMSERLRRRERELLEQLDRQQTEAARRIRADFEDLERRQKEQLDRVLSRATERFSEAAEKQFADVVRAARDDAVRRFGRELDRAGEQVMRDAQPLLAEKLAQVSTTGEQRLEKRLSSAAEGLERRYEELSAGLEARTSQLEADVRRRLQALMGDMDVERQALEARSEELARRIDEALGSLEERVQGTLRAG